MEQSACHFVFYTGPLAGQAEAFNTARITLGRASNCDFRIDSLGSDAVAAHHAEVLLEEGVWYLYDLSKAGCFVNGERVQERCSLMSGDYIQFGDDGPEVLFRTGTPQAGYQPLPKIFPEFAQLEFFAGSDAGRVFPINAGAVTRIGRRTELEVPLDPRGDMIVSGNHCALSYQDGVFVITDTSRNGTYVNGELVEGAVEVGDGDVIMLGDGGPQARLQIDNRTRSYPNRRPLNAAAPKQHLVTPTPVSAPQSVAPVLPPAPPEPLPPPENVAPIPVPEPVPQAPVPDDIPTAAATPLDLPTDGGLDDDIDEFPAAVMNEDESVVTSLPVDDGAFDSNAPTPVGQTVAPARRRFQVPRMRPLPRSAILITGAALAVLTLIIIISSMSGSKPAKGTKATVRITPVDYAATVEAVEPITFDGQDISVNVPQAWTNRSSDNGISIESSDKEVAVDYYSEPALSEEAVRRALGRNGGQVARVEGVGQGEDGAKLKTFVARAGNLNRMAVLHEPEGSAPVVALLETSNDIFKTLSPAVLDDLLVKNITLPKPPAPTPALPEPTAPAVAAVVPSPAPESTPAATLPSPAAETPTPSVDPAPVATPAPTPTTEPVPVTTPAPTPEAAVADAGTSPTGTQIESKALKLKLNVPEGWNGTSEEADAMVTLRDSESLEIRVARDPGKMSSSDTFSAMKQEGWKLENTKTETSFSAAEFNKADQNLMLVLVPETAGTTLVIYATSKKDFSPDQRRGIVSIIQQVRPLSR